MPQQPERIRRIQELLGEVWTENPSLELLSSAAGVHPDTVSKYFHKYFGSTLGQCLRKLKIEKALALMNQANCSFTEVTYHCGFAGQSHIIRTFNLNN